MKFRIMFLSLMFLFRSLVEGQAPTQALILKNPSLTLKKIPNAKEIKFKPFTLKDMRGAYKNNALKITDSVNVRNNQKATIEKVLNELNGIEKWLNSFGHSLRGKTLGPPPVIGRVEIPMQRHPRPIPMSLLNYQTVERAKGQPCNGQLVSPPALSWIESVGDPSIVSIAFSKQLIGINGIYGITGNGHMGLDINFAGQQYSLLAIDNKFFLPQGHLDKDKDRFGSASFSVLGVAQEDRKDCQIVSACDAEKGLSVSIPIASEAWPVWVIPAINVPIMLRLSLSSEVGGKVSSHAAPLDGKVEWEAWVTVKATGQLYAELGVLEVGPGVDFNLAVGKLSESGNAVIDLPPKELTVHGTYEPNLKNGTTFNWNHTREFDISAGGGSVYLFITIGLPCEDIPLVGSLIGDRCHKEFRFEIYSWQDNPIFCASTSDEIAVCRPSASDNKFVYCSNSGSPVDIGYDPTNCGGCGVSCGLNGICGTATAAHSESPGHCTKTGPIIGPPQNLRVIPVRAIPPRLK